MEFQPWTVEEVAQITGGTMASGDGGQAVSGVVIDSRIVKQGNLYVPIIGEKNDGHRFIPAACENGAAAYLCDTAHCDQYHIQGAVKIVVPSTMEALRKLAAANRARYQIPVVAVTGSAGKTTTKDLIASVLSVKKRVMKTQGNFNNEIGVPLTLFQLTPEHEAAVVEMGMNHLGEIHRSIFEVKPHIGVITNIGSAHLENLGTKDNTLRAKKEILETMDAQDIALVNGDDPYLRKVVPSPYQVMRIGIHQDDVDFKAQHIVQTADGVSFEVFGEKYHFKYPGEHNVYNCLMAIGVGLIFDYSPSEIQEGLDRFVPSGNRMKKIQIDGRKLIDDSYNANPESVKAALNTVSAQAEGRVIAVLGDMLEIGKDSSEKHRETGAYAAEKTAVLIAVGPLSEAMADGAKGKGIEVHHVDDADAAAGLIKEISQPGDTILLKASHGMNLHHVTEVLQTAADQEK
ncbi:UDP-N-acetylmuramoyl-tripeptide--D-alanyl-D-alanine ligase [Pseudoramibacter sp.]|jgi:UDP-N-acetylmuramoyl-tripeptide--D-alanyl-D-alanine ligase|uniref:UDP-N-acetylmuramoyl-tripeptide--D-alanyl-D- alanine ligase n=1 Tax=Pseudoramibacter sp. TaxID=2034862 RepID=UPI0025DA5048|nr:UDP-N-acetylmuramoyl-tripeptide--D-alanyl-D-alanine ligase [Pseudoramibacter sp.]MCH4072627.1 UDP-N-acetylmuramoyl-tripeptide--D-alanyl-D-alanine ligase [Pseudoramibacter sp.]MCH4106398.1 UDP-N-acetylmuramoyl-tripeptide--D-alanyl-D-alanine ligase [Pseudoramibacter sp.]